MKVDVESKEPHRSENLVLVPEQRIKLPGHPGLGGGGRVVGVADAGPPALSLVEPWSRDQDTGLPLDDHVTRLGQ